MKKIALSLVVALVAILAADQAEAQRRRGPGEPTPPRAEESCKSLEGNQLEACKVMGAYLDAWKQKNWAEVRKLTHPKTIEELEKRKKDHGLENHRMAPWYWARETYVLHDWRIDSVEDAALETVVFNLHEDTYRVMEDGIANNEPSSFLVGKYQGKWFVVDRRGGGGGFTETAITIGKPGYFDAEKEAKKEPKKEEPKEERPTGRQRPMPR